MMENMTAVVDRSPSWEIASSRDMASHPCGKTVTFGFRLAGVGRVADAFPLGLLLCGCLSVAWKCRKRMEKGNCMALPFEKKEVKGI